MRRFIKIGIVCYHILLTFVPSLHLFICFNFKGIKILDSPLEGTLPVKIYLEVEDTVTEMWGKSRVQNLTADKGLL